MAALARGAFGNTTVARDLAWRRLPAICLTLAALALSCSLDGRPLSLKAGELCSSDADCFSESCELAAEPGSRRICCEAACAPGQLCRSDGKSCDSEQAPQPQVSGEACSEGLQCESGFCTDGVCCDERCGAECERCDAPGRAGECVADAACSSVEPECENGACSLPNGATCSTDDECGSGNCEPFVGGGSICCEVECAGPCQRCSAAGRCDAFPPQDPRCPEPECESDTSCRAFAPPERFACVAPGECAACSHQDQPDGRFCGSGEQCLQGSCTFTGVGLVAAGGSHTCIVRQNGNLRCWGRNLEGQLGARFDLERVGINETPSDVTGLDIAFERTILQVVAGYHHTCVLLATPPAAGKPPSTHGSVRCFGSSPSPSHVTTADLMGTPDIELNDLGFVEPLRTHDVALGERSAVQISAHREGEHTCALLDDGSVRCWGLNNEGQLGLGHDLNVGNTSTEPLAPIQLPRPTALAIKAGITHTCALLDNRKVTCWGEGEHGALGFGGTDSRFAPLGEIELGAPALDIAPGGGFTCALIEGAAGRALRCWGHNDRGVLGYGHTEWVGDDPGETPAAAARMRLALPDGSDKPLAGDVQVGWEAQQVEAGLSAVCARSISGAVRCWGANVQGSLGYGHDRDIGDELTPAEAARVGSVSGEPSGRFNLGGDMLLGGPAIALASGGRCALMSGTERDIDLTCWGDSDDGELGLGPTKPGSSRGYDPQDLGRVPYD